MYCNYCGKSIQDDANVCAYCGTRVGGVIARKRLVRPRGRAQNRRRLPGRGGIFRSDVTIVRLGLADRVCGDRNWPAVVPNRMDRDARRSRTCSLRMRALGSKSRIHSITTLPVCEL